jgi:hypothetical protein
MKYESLGLKEAVQLIAGRLDGENAKARERKASGELYEALRHGRVRSRAGRVDRAEQVRNPEGDYGKSAPLWALANWPIPAALWQVTTVYQYSRDFSVSWVYPANEPKPDGWPAGPVRLSDIEVSTADIDQMWPMPKGTRVRALSVSTLSNFLMNFADGSKSEAECREAAKEHFRLKSIPDKNVWRQAFQAIPSALKLPRGRPAKSNK